MSVKVSRLANGLHVVSHHMPHIETVALGIWVKAGARDERLEENGIAHFLEHMAFKGTSRRTAQQIAEDIENSGGEINAATGMETTTYYARVLKTEWRGALDILADIFLNSVLDPDEVERERDVILQEIAAAKDQPDDLVFDLAQAACYGDHPLGRSILGPTSIIETVTREQMLAWRSRNYWASRIVVSAAGNIDHEQLTLSVNELFGEVPQGHMPQRMPPVFAHDSQTEQKQLDQTHIVLTFPAPNYRDPRIYQMQILSSILGGGMSSRLFQDVREKRGLCYSVFSFGTSYEDVGQLGVYAATSPENTAELVNVTTDVMLSMIDLVTDKEVARAKAQLKASLVMNLESAASRADQIARQFLAFGEIPDMQTLIDRIDKVVPDEVRNLAESIFSNTKPALSAVGQLSFLGSHAAIAARFVKV